MSLSSTLNKRRGVGSVVSKNQTVSSDASSYTYPLKAPLPDPVVWSKVSGHTNLSVSGSTIALASAINNGDIQTIIVRGVNGTSAVEFQVALTGYAVPAVVSAVVSLSAAITNTEGDSDVTHYTWTLTLTRNGSTDSYPFSWAITGSGSNPANAADFGGTLPSGSGTFASGETTKSIDILVAGDTTIESNETFLLTVTTAGLNIVTSTGTINNDDAAPSIPFAVMEDLTGQSRLVGTNNLDDMVGAGEQVSTRVKFANLSYLGDTGLAQFLPLQIVKTGNTISGVSGKATEYLSPNGISHITGIGKFIANDGTGFLPGVTEAVFFKDAASGTPYTNWWPGGGGFNTQDSSLRTIASTYVAANDTRMSNITYIQGSAEAQALEDELDPTNSGVFDTIVSTALADTRIANWGNPISAQTRRARREYYGIDTLPFIIVGYVLPAYSGSGANFSVFNTYTQANHSNAARIREGVGREAMNLCRYVVTLAADTNSITVTDRGDHRWTTTWDTVNDKPIFTDSGIVDTRCDSFSYYIDIRGMESPDGLHEHPDTQLKVGKAIKLLLESIYGTGGIPPVQNTITHIKSIFYEPIALSGTATATAADVTLTASEVGTAHIGVYASGSTKPTAAQIVAGTGTGFLQKFTKASTRRTSITQSLTGLTGSTTYDVYAVNVYSGQNSVVSGPAVITTAVASGGGSTGNEPTVVGIANGFSGSNVALTVPADAAAGDVMLLLVETADEAVTAPSGFVEVTGSPSGTNGGVTGSSTAITRLTAQWKRWVAETTVTVVDAGNHQTCTLLLIRGAIATGVPYEAATFSPSATLSTAGTIAGGTTLGGDRLVITAATSAVGTTTAQFSGWTNAALTNYAEIVDNCGNAGNGGCVGVATGVKVTAGDVGTSTVTYATSSGKVGLSLAFIPD